MKDDYGYGSNLNRMIYLYNELCDENIEIEFNYTLNGSKKSNILKNVSNGKNKERIRIFGDGFIINNLFKCKFEYNGIENELFDFIEDYNYKDPIKLKLKGINNIIDASWMFHRCNSFSSLPDLSKWDISKVNDLRGMFKDCNNLLSLPDISKWNTSNVTDMSEMFSGCNTLLSLPDISKWDILNVKNLNKMFYDCKSLNSLPDLSKWNISNVKEMTDMFAECKKSLKIPSRFNK